MVTWRLYIRTEDGKSDGSAPNSTEFSFRVPAYRAACRLVRSRMGHRQLALAAAACAYALASAARGAHAQLSQVEALVVSCDGVGSAPRCARACRPGQISCARQLRAGGNYA